MFTLFELEDEVWFGLVVKMKNVPYSLALKKFMRKKNVKCESELTLSILENKGVISFSLGLNYNQRNI